MEEVLEENDALVLVLLEFREPSEHNAALEHLAPDRVRHRPVEQHVSDFRLSAEDLVLLRALIHFFHGLRLHHVSLDNISAVSIVGLEIVFKCFTIT